jgi:hypothetical protein
VKIQANRCRSVGTYFCTAVGFLGCVFAGRFCFVDIVRQSQCFGLANCISKTGQLIGCKETLSSIFGILFDAPGRIEPNWRNLALTREGVKASYNSQHAVRLIRPIPHFSVKLGHVSGCDLFCLSASERRQHDPFEQAPVVCSRCRLPLRLDMLCEESLG